MNRNATKISAIIHLVVLCSECVLSLICCIVAGNIWLTTIAHDMTMRQGVVTVSYVLPIIFLLSLYLIFRQGKIYKIASRPMKEFTSRKIYRLLHMIFTLLLCAALAVCIFAVFSDKAMGHAADMLAKYAIVCMAIHVLCLLTMGLDSLKAKSRYRELSETAKSEADFVKAK